MKHYLILALALGFTACMNEESPTSSQTTLQPGQLQIVAMTGMGNGGLSKISVQPSDSFTYAFNLDTAKSSIQEYFILQNTGDFNIKNVVFTTNNPQFYFSPSTISLLPPSKSSSILQVIALNVIHGTQLNGVGPDSLLLLGSNTATAQLTASTTDAHGDSVGISQSAKMTVYAEVMDCNFYGTNSTTPAVPCCEEGGSAGTFDELVPEYGLSGTVRIVNTGNVPITFFAWHDGTNTVAPSDTFVVKPDSTDFVSAANVLQLNGQGAVTIPGKFERDSYGNIVLHL